MDFKDKSDVIAIGLMVFGFLLRFVTGWKALEYHGDVYVYAASAMHIAQGDGYSIMANGVLWTPWLPPGYPVTLALFYLIFGVSDLSASFYSNLFGSLSILILYLLGKHLFDEKVGLIAALIMTFSPYHIVYSTHTMSHVVASFIILASSLSFIKGIKKDNYLFLGLTGFFLGWGVTIRLDSILIVLPWGLYLLLTKPLSWLTNKKILGLFAVFLLTIFPYLSFNYLHYGNPFQSGYGGFWTIEQQPWFSIEYLLKGDPIGYLDRSHLFGYLRALFFDFISIRSLEYDYLGLNLYSSPTIPFFLIVGLALMIYHKKRSELAILGTWLLAFLLFFSIYIWFHRRFLFSAYPAAFLVSAYGIGASIRFLNRRLAPMFTFKHFPRLMSILLTIILVVVTFYPHHYTRVLFTCQTAPGATMGQLYKETGLWIRTHTESNAFVITHRPQYLEFYARRSCLTMRSREAISFKYNGETMKLEDLLSRTFPVYIINDWRCEDLFQDLHDDLVLQQKVEFRMEVYYFTIYQVIGVR